MDEYSPELEEIVALENAMKWNDMEYEETETESAESSHFNVPELKERPVLNKAEWNKKIEEDFLELEDRILRGTVELEEALDIIKLKKKKESKTLKLEENNSVSRRNGDEIINRQANEKSFLETQDRILRKTLELEEALEKRKKSEALKLEEALEKRKKSEALKLEERNSVARQTGDEIIHRQSNVKEVLESQDRILRKILELEEASEKKKELEVLKLLERNPVARRSLDNEDGIIDRQTETQIPLMGEESVSIDLNDGSESSKVDPVKRLKINTNKKADLKKIFRSLSLISEERRPSVSSALRQISNAKQSSTSAFDCCKNTIGIIASLFLYILYVCGLSIVSIAMLVIGSMYLEQCTVQPYIPIYLVVGGAFGTFYNFIAISRKHFCGKSATFGSFDGIINLFLLVWFILGCVWVYGVTNVEYYNTLNSDYCHKTLYLFAFWFLNCIFILLGASVALCVCALCCGAC